MCFPVFAPTVIVTVTLFTCFILLLNSYSSLNFFFVSCSFNFSSYNLYFSIFVCSSLFLHSLFICFSLFASTAKATFSRIEFSFILQLCSSSRFSETFHFPLPFLGLMPFDVFVVASRAIVFCKEAFQVISILTGSRSLEAL